MNPQNARSNVARAHFVLLAWLVAAVLLPRTVSAQLHGAYILMNSTGPSLTAQVHVGDTVTAAIRVQSADEFGDSLTFTNIVDLVHHGSGDVASSNLLTAPLTLTNYGTFGNVAHTFVVQASDPDFLLNEAIAKGRDNHDGPGGSHLPQDYLLTFPAQIHILRPAIQISRSCPASPGLDGFVTYVGSVSNSGNTLLTNVVISNFVSGASSAVLGPTNLASQGVITFTNSYRTSGSPPTGTDALQAWGTDALGMRVSNSTASNPPPQVSILSPAAGSSFTAPANIFISASATNPGAAIVQVDFFAGTNLIGSAFTSPFGLTWSNVPPGSYSLVARATDSRCGSALSAPVNVTGDPMSTPAFRFEQAAYSVGEGDGTVTLRVVRNFSGFATVNYATADLSANSGVDYLAAAGSLQFQSADTFQTITVTIREDAVVEGSESFLVSLSLPSGGGLTNPAVATVTIVDNDVQTGSSDFSIVPPAPVDENSLGSLRVYLVGEGGLGQWRLTWERTWRASGTAATGLPAGEYEIEFKPVTSTLIPPLATLFVLPMQERRSTNSYTQLVSTPPGSLTVFIDPSDVSDAGEPTCRGQWQRDGEGAVWHDSGQTTAGLPADNYLVHFKTLTGPCSWGAPASRYVTVFPGASNALRSSYYWNLAGPVAPQPLNFTTEIQNGYGFGYPYPFSGQIVTEVGEASGFVVKERVVLTAAHVVFDDYALSYNLNIRWLFQRHAGEYNPNPQTVRGFYVNAGYAAQRQIEETPGVSQTASFDLDVAALYFYERAGRGGSGGYLVSDSPSHQWLLSNQLTRVLVGYPVEGIAEANRGKMHAIRPQPIIFSPVSNAVFASTTVRSFPGNSGGPLCVLLGNGFYYPAGIFVGGSDKTIVRAIDSRAAELINQAELTANVGTNNGAGGVVRLTPIPDLGFCDGFATVTLEPSFATAADAAWRVAPRYTRFGTLTSWTTNNTLKLPLNNGAFEMEFRAAEGFVPPAPPDLELSCGARTNLVFRYVQLLPRLDVLEGTNLMLSGVASRQYRVEFNPLLGSSNAWIPLTNVTFPATNGTAVIANALAPGASNRFFRAVRVP